MTVYRAVLAALWLLLGTSSAHAFDPHEASIQQLQGAMHGDGLTSAELVAHYLERIERLDRDGPRLNSIALVNPKALEDARALDEERRVRGPRGPLHGIPLLVKDNYETLGMPTTAGSKVLAGFAPERDAELVERLRAAGAVILGKTTMHEFAYGFETWGSAFGATRNPYDISRNAGGSSGGTGAAVAANLAVAGLGSDTCGSIRVPSAHNALVGLRGTQGASSRDGIIPLSSTQDIGGPLARSVADLALLLDVTVGYDPDDAQTAASVGHFDASFVDALNPGALRGQRIGIVRELRSVDPEDLDVARVFDAAMERIVGLGAETVEVSIPMLGSELFEVRDGYYVLTHDVARDIDHYLSSRPGAPVRTLRDIIDTGLAITQVQERLQTSLDLQADPRETYLAEFRKRSLLRTAIYQVMAQHDLDALAYPTIRRIAAPLTEPQSGANCHLSANSGFPAVTVPGGWVDGKMPVGLELLGRPWDDAYLLGLAYAFEQATRFRRPPDLEP